MDDIVNIAAIVVVFAVCLCVLFCVGMALVLLTGALWQSATHLFDKLSMKIGW